MLEVAMTPEAREAFQKAHKERARAFKAAIEWISGRRSASQDRGADMRRYRRRYFPWRPLMYGTFKS